jgi:hypothetical protein
MSGSYSLTDFIKVKPQKKKGGNGANSWNGANGANSASVSNNTNKNPAALQMENDMRKLLHQLLEKMYADRRRGEIIEQLIREMRDKPAEFVNVFTNYRSFYDHIARVDSIIG